MRNGSCVGEWTVKYPEHWVTPEDFLIFVELDEFIQDWEDLGLDAEDDIVGLMLSIMCNPKGAPVIKGTGGLRKLRYSPPSWQKGASGAIRVCYVYFETHWKVVLVMAYGKSEKGDLTMEERKAIKQYIEQSQKWLDDRNY